MAHECLAHTCTYFPPESRWGRPGFKEILERIKDVWESNKDGILNQADKITQTLKDRSALTPLSATPQFNAEPLDLGFEQFKNSYDSEYGGFGRAPKFPRPVTLNFLLRYFARQPAASREGKKIPTTTEVNVLMTT